MIGDLGRETAIGLFPSTDHALAAVVEQTPLGRLGEARKMGDAVVFPAPDAARFITGAGLPVDGGMGL
jgi:NAD(P)-dependent dehydrogenase (short-subunit alcohol dehydrogenase family)